MAATEELSAYELERLDNIRRNKEKLEALGLGTGIVPNRPTPTIPVRRPKKDSNRPAAVPSRRSGRLEGVKAANVYIEHEAGGSGTKCLVTFGGDRAALEADKRSAEAAAAEAAMDPLSLFALGAQPEDESDLLEGEKQAWQALYNAKRDKARELQIESYKVAQHRTLCEVSRPSFRPTWCSVALPPFSCQS